MISRLSYLLMTLAALSFLGATLTRGLRPRFYFLFNFSQYIDLTIIFLLGAILLTLRELLANRR